MMKVTLSDKKGFPVDEKMVLVILNEGKTATIREDRERRHLLTMGLGKRTLMTRRKLQTSIRKITQTAKDAGYRKLVLRLDDFYFPSLETIPDKELTSIIVQNVLISNFVFDHFKSKSETKKLQKLFLVGQPTTERREGVERGRKIANAVNQCRVLANTPGGAMTPQLLAEETEKAVRGTPVTLTIFDKKRIEKEGMDALLGVAKGSVEDPRFLILEYWGAEGKDGKRKNGVVKEDPVVFVGKGITFDSGGLNLKVADGMVDMYMDMSGGAVVIHTLLLAARLNLKKNVIGLIPVAENMTSGSSYRPGDVLRSLSGKTIEIVNTDAEGRVILADALTYAKRYKPRLVVDIATLTGAALVALGAHAHAVMTRDKPLMQQLIDCGEESGDYAWPLPLWDEYEQYVVGAFGDVANLPSIGNSRYGGAISGGMFLYQFAKSYPTSTKWAHIDMAPRMTAAPGDYLSKGATGEPIRLLLSLLESF